MFIMNKGGNFYALENFNAWLVGYSKISSTNPYRVLPQFQGTEENKKITG